MMMRIRTRAIAAVLLSGLLIGAPAASAVEEVAANESAVSIPSADYDIAGVLALPDDAETPVPAVLMLHGYGSSADEVGDMYARLAEALAARGVGSLRVDFAGMGASPASTLEYSYGTMISDAATALDWLVAHESVDAQRVGVQGFSLGSLIGAHLVGTDPRPIAFGSWSGAIYDGEPAVYDPQLAECEATGEGHIVVDLGFRTLDHSCEYFRSMAASTALTDFAAYDGALLLVAGSDDTVVDPTVSEHAATASASDDVTLEISDGADHIYQVLTEDQSFADRVIDLTADWFASRL